MKLAVVGEVAPTGSFIASSSVTWPGSLNRRPPLHGHHVRLERAAKLLPGAAPDAPSSDLMIR